MQSSFQRTAICLAGSNSLVGSCNVEGGPCTAAKTFFNHGGEILSVVLNWSLYTSKTPPLACGLHGGGWLLRKHSTLILLYFLTCSLRPRALTIGPNYFLLGFSSVVTWLVEALLTTWEEGLELCWLHLLLQWKCCGSSFLIITQCFWHRIFLRMPQQQVILFSVATLPEQWNVFRWTFVK